AAGGHVAVPPGRRVVRGVDGADRLARRVAAPPAQHRDEADGLVLALRRLVRLLAVLLVPVEVALDADPVQDAALRDLLGADDADVVLRVARGDARRAADAALEVDRHRPARLRVRVLAVVRAGRRVVLRTRRDGGRAEAAHVLELADHRLHGVDLGAVAAGGGLQVLLAGRAGRQRDGREPRGLGMRRLLERHRAGDLAPGLRRVAGLGDPLPAAGGAERGADPLPDQAARGLVDPGADQARGVDPAALRVAAERLVALAELNRDRVRPQAGVRPHGQLDAAVRRRDLGDAALDQTEPLGGLRVDLDPRDPGDLADRVGQLLEPRAVGERAV